MDYHLAGFPEHGNTKPIIKAFKHSIKNKDREACGIFVLDGFDFSFVPIENSFLKNKDYFIGENETFSKYLINKKIFCLFHSHTIDSVSPSELDIEIAESLCIPSYIFSVSSRDSYLYFPKNHNPPDLYGRVFIDQLQDCIVFFKDFYLKKLNIDLSEQYKNWGRVRVSPNDYLISNLESNFNLVENRKDIKYGDVFVFRQSITNFFHLGVYSGDGEISHHPYSMLSLKELITNDTWNQVYKVYRYKEI